MRSQREQADGEGDEGGEEVEEEVSIEVNDEDITMEEVAEDDESYEALPVLEPNEPGENHDPSEM